MFIWAFAHFRLALGVSLSGETIQIDSIKHKIQGVKTASYNSLAVIIKLKGFYFLEN